MWIDTHVHFDAPEFADTRTNDWVRAQQEGVCAQVIPSVTPLNFITVRRLAHQYKNSVYALGIHPMYVNSLDVESALAALRTELMTNIDDPKLVAIGEIGLDGFVKNLDINRQIQFYQAQLKLAREFALPVLLHVRHAQDVAVKYLRQYAIQRGIAHAFNGSFAQAQAYIKQGMMLGFGGMITFDRAKQIRRLACDIPIETMVLETDAPDIPPVWAYKQNNYSYYLPRIAQTLADLRRMQVDELSKQLRSNSISALPKLSHTLDARV